MRPRQLSQKPRGARFVRRCLTNFGLALRVGLVKQAAVLEVSGREAAPKTGGQLGGQPVKQALTIASPILPTLLRLHNLALNEPICQHHLAVDRGSHTLARIFQNSDDTAQQIARQSSCLGHNLARAHAPVPTKATKTFIASSTGYLSNDIHAAKPQNRVRYGLTVIRNTSR